MWILLVVELIAIVIFMPKLRKKVNKQQGEEEQRIHNKIDEEMENMTFQEGSEYLLKNKKEKWNSLKKDVPKIIVKVISIAFPIAIVIILVMAIDGFSPSINMFLNVWVEVSIFVALISFFYLKKPGFNFFYAELKLKKIYEKEICQPVLDKRNYHNVLFGIANIRDREIGLTRGDEYLDTDDSITCDEFTYRKVAYYHEVEHENAKGHTYRERVTTFDGNEIFLPCNTMVEDTVRIIPSITKHSGKENIYISCGRLEGEEHVDIEDIEFNQEFEVYAKNPHDAYIFLNSQRIEYLKQLRKKYIIAVVVKNEGIYIATNTTSWHFTSEDLKSVNFTSEDFKSRYFTSGYFKLPDIKSEKDPIQYFENNMNNFEIMLEEFKKIM